MRPFRWLSRLFRRRSLERELDAELRFHFDEHVRELIAQGLSPGEARRRARHALGGIDQVKERARDVRGTRWLEDWWQDTHYTLRGLRRSPRFAIVAVLTLGLGIGAATAVFSAVDAVLFEPLAYPDSERIVKIAEASGPRDALAFGTYREMAERSRSFAALAVFKPWQPTLTGRGEPERLQGQQVSASFFDVLGVAPALGRGFDPPDDRVGGPDVVILSDGLWHGRFGADPGIVGRQVRLDDAPYTVLGVMPRGFGSIPGRPAQAWSLLQYDASLPSHDGREWGRHLSMIGRLQSGVGLDIARRELDRLAAHPVPEIARPAWAGMERGLHVTSLRTAATAGVRPALLALLGAVVLLLGIVCVNVANLLLAQGARRRGELALRAALGAARGRLVRQLLTESLLLAGLGGALGLVIARLGLGTLVTLSPPELPRTDAIGLDATAFVFALAVTTVIGLLAGLAPALRRSRGDLQRGIREACGRTAGTHLSTRRALVVGQVALALVLLVGAGLMLRSVRHLFAVAPGFDPSQMLVMQVQTAGHEFADRDAVHGFFQGALDAVRPLPGVTSAAWTSQLPLSGELDQFGVELEDAGRADGEGGAAYRYAVSPGYFDTMGIPLFRGRLLDGDKSGAPGAVVISESLAERAFPGRDPIGERMHVGRTDLPRYTIVGVVGDVKQASLEAGPAAAVYVTPRQWYFADRALWLVIRADGDPAALTADVKRAIWSVDPDQPIVRLATMEDLVARSEAQRRFAFTMLQAFALLALALAAVGVYGVVSGSVTERMHEIGVRSALGASRRRILALVSWQGIALVGPGLVIGLVAAAYATEALATLLYGVSRLDPLTYLAMVLVLAAVSAVACWIPASRAARVDPVRTLRAE